MTITFETMPSKSILLLNLGHLSNSIVFDKLKDLFLFQKNNYIGFINQQSDD